MCTEYEKVSGLLESICELVSNENAKVNIKTMVKEIAPYLKQV